VGRKANKRFLEYCWSCKNTLGKHAVAVNTGRHLIQVLNERRVTDGGNLCPLCMARFQGQN